MPYWYFDEDIKITKDNLDSWELYDYYLEKNGITTAWDEKSFAILVTDKYENELKELYNAFLNLDVAVGIAPSEVFKNGGLKFCIKSRLPKETIEKIIKKLDKIYFGETSKINEYLTQIGYEPLSSGVSAKDLLKRNGVSYTKMKEYLTFDEDLTLDNLGDFELEVMVKYEGYIESERKEAIKFNKLESVKLDTDVDYMKIDGLRIEARQKLNAVKPSTLGQASRISGVNPSDISVLILNLKKEKRL